MRASGTAVAEGTVQGHSRGRNRRRGGGGGPAATVASLQGYGQEAGSQVRFRVRLTDLMQVSRANAQSSFSVYFGTMGMQTAHSSPLHSSTPTPLNTRHKRSLSISGYSFKISDGASSPRSTTRHNDLVKRRSASLAAGAAPPSSAELDLRPPSAIAAATATAAADDAKEFKFTVVGNWGGSGSGSDDGDDGGPGISSADRDSRSPPDAEPPLLVARRTA